MAISDIPIFAMLRTRMHWHQERQRVLAENVANADTPNYRPNDLAEPKFNLPAPGSGPLQLVRTDAGHIGGSTGASGFRSESRPYQVRPAGNAVSLEDEMLKVAANQMDFQAVSALYTKGLGLIKLAVGRK